MKKEWLIFFYTFLILGCGSDDETNLLKNRFHGKYELISSASQEPVDLNRDGISSINLLDENPSIGNATLELRILEGGRHLLAETWPVEYVSGRDGHVTDSAGYQPGYTVEYFFPVNAEPFRFDNNLRSLQLLEEFNNAWPCTIQSIESITIEENDVINLKLLRKLYTREGWITVKIESRFIRFTTIT